MLQGDLKTFFELYLGEVKIRASGDSQAVLSQSLRDSYNFKVCVAIRVKEIQTLVGAIVPKVQFYHISGTLNPADILTRTHKGSPLDLPYIHNCDLDVTAATPYNDKGNLDNLPEVNRKQIHTNTANSTLCRQGRLTSDIT